MTAIELHGAWASRRIWVEYSQFYLAPLDFDFSDFDGGSAEEILVPVRDRAIVVLTKCHTGFVRVHAGGRSRPFVAGTPFAQGSIADADSRVIEADVVTRSLLRDSELFIVPWGGVVDPEDPSRPPLEFGLSQGEGWYDVTICAVKAHQLADATETLEEYYISVGKRDT